MNVVIIGGGIAGLTASILLRRRGWKVILLEKNKFPFHRVCGEYVSNEVVPFLKENDLWPGEIGPAAISSFHLSDTSGKELKMPLDLGGFGISRYALDDFFLQQALADGVQVLTSARVESVEFQQDYFLVRTRDKEFITPVVIGAYGKRSHLDKQMNRSFMSRRSPYIGVKYHVRISSQPADTVALHNFEGGYCGLNAVENGVFNLCYLSHRDNLRTHKDISAMEENVLCRNPVLRNIFEVSERLWENPLVINEISFETKEPVIGHVLMCGDAAGMIAPLCGNGIAMAIHSAKILTDTLIEKAADSAFNRSALEDAYRRAWKSQFAFRLSSGRQIQRLFGRPFFSSLAVSLGTYSKSVARYLMKQTHGQPFR